MEIGPDSEIKPRAPRAPYKQLAEILRARIDRGDWEPGEPISSEARLVQEYGLARSTVRRAIGLLAEDGTVFVVPQRGVYVNDTQG